MKYDVIGIGNAIVDVLSQAEEQFLTAEGLAKGSMSLIDAERAEALYAQLGAGKEVSGGSVANTCAGIASLGGKSAYIGKVAHDKLGSVFAHDIKAAGVDFCAPEASQAEPPTARCIILVTPDAQRTMNTYLGACVELGPEDIDEEAIINAGVTYLEGYLWDPPKAKEAMLKAAKIAQKAGRKVALSLSDSFCVGRHRDSFNQLIDEHVDLLFANADEALALTETKSISEAVEALKGRVELAVITQGEEGALVVSEDGTSAVAAVTVEKLVDTTGAGDLFAAGFLYGYCQKKSPSECAELGSIAAAEVISHYGARPEVKLDSLIPPGHRVAAPRRAPVQPRA
jgi:sugar/nucleoside kinase (ribokinase family)